MDVRYRTYSDGGFPVMFLAGIFNPIAPAWTALQACE
jgi:hypothetical protein